MKDCSRQGYLFFNVSDGPNPMTLLVSLTEKPSSRKRYSLKELDVEVKRVVVDTIVMGTETMLFPDAVGNSVVAGAPLTELQNSAYTLVARAKSAVFDVHVLLRHELRLRTTIG